MSSIHDFSISIATVNGSGSQSANFILLKTLFRHGVYCVGKNIFPSNIQGLPTWYRIRCGTTPQLSYREPFDVVVALNKKTLGDDLKSLRIGGNMIVLDELSTSLASLQATSDMAAGMVWTLPGRSLVEDINDSIKVRKLLINMLYVGALVSAMELDSEILKQVIADQFQGKSKLIEWNHQAVMAGWNYAETQNWRLAATPLKNQFDFKDQVLMDGNTAAALGAYVGGCRFFSWYPITPSSSLAENFQAFDHKLGGEHPRSRAAIIQAEDELAAISMVIGAGWAGARAMTATSGPGISLMTEAAGLAYFAEVPAVIWDIQRVGPSTGLPTRTSQGDVFATHFMSHGDTEHLVLIPGNIEECFEYAQLALNLAEQYQTLVVVLSDLDLGMNWSTTAATQFQPLPIERGKVLGKDEVTEDFARYRDVDGDGVPYRTLPGTEHPAAGFFTRGTSHDARALYSEKAEVYQELNQRLKRKIKTATDQMPKPVVGSEPSRINLIYYGSSQMAVEEWYQQAQLRGDNQYNLIRLRALPVSETVNSNHFVGRSNIVIEQNRDGQMAKILRARFPDSQFESLAMCSGMPLSAQDLATHLDSIISRWDSQSRSLS